MKNFTITIPLTLDEETFFKLKAICEVEKMDQTMFIKNYINNIFGFKKLYSDEYFDFLNKIKIEELEIEGENDEENEL